MMLDPEMMIVRLLICLPGAVSVGSLLVTRVKVSFSLHHTFSPACVSFGANLSPVAPVRPTPNESGVASDDAPDPKGNKDVTFAALLGLPAAPEEDVDKPDANDDSSGGLVLEDLQFYRIKSLPPYCQVMHRDLQDPLLKKYYVKSLPPLRFVVCLSLDHHL